MFTKEQVQEAIAIAFEIGHRWSYPESISDSIEYALKNHDEPEQIDGSMHGAKIFEAIGPETPPAGYSRAFVEAVARRALVVGARVGVLANGLDGKRDFPQSRSGEWELVAKESANYEGTKCTLDDCDEKILIPHCFDFVEDQLGEKATEPDISNQLLGAPARIRLSNGVVVEGHVIAMNDGRIDLEETIGGFSGQLVGTAMQPENEPHMPHKLSLYNLGFEAGKLGASWHDVKDDSWKKGCIAGRNVAAAEKLLENLKAQGEKADQ